MRIRATMILLLCVFCAVVALRPAPAQQPEPAKTVDRTIDTARETQRRQDGWAEEKADLTVRYRNAAANVRYLEERIEIERGKAEALDERIAEFERRIAETTRLRANLQDTLVSISRRLEARVAADMPFLARERAARLAALERELARPDASGAEKLRRTLEALQIETAYGSTVEVLQERIAVGADTLFVDLLRIGRIGLFWRTPDGRRSGEYDVGAGAWVELPAKHHRSIATALDMAARIRPVEITDLPLGRIAR